MVGWLSKEGENMKLVGKIGKVQVLCQSSTSPPSPKHWMRIYSAAAGVGINYRNRRYSYYSAGINYWSSSRGRILSRINPC